MRNNWVWALNAIDNCCKAAYNAKNEKFKEYWYGVAEKLEQKYCAGQPWLRTYDGKLD